MNRMTHLLNRSNWPLPLQQYDCRVLSQQEMNTITAVLHKRARRASWFEQAQTDLERLVTPIVDALHLLNVKPKYRNELLYIFLFHQHKTQTAFWQWTDDHWHTAYKYIVQRRQQGFLASSLSHFLNTAYLLTGFADFDHHQRFDALHLVSLVFDSHTFSHGVQQIVGILTETGFHVGWCETWIPRALAVLCLKHHSTDLSDISLDTLRAIHDARTGKFWRRACIRIGFALEQMGLLANGLEASYMPQTTKKTVEQARSGIAIHWLEWVDRWVESSPYSPANRKTHYRCLLLVGRWLAREHPTVTSPKDWTRDLAVTFVAAVVRLNVGDWAYLHYKQKQGQPLSAYTKSRYLSVMRSFFTDLQEWGWIDRRFDPRRCLSVPRTVQGLLVLNAKPIDPAIWKKLVIAALHLNEADLSTSQTWRYPLEMVKALAAMWVFSGLRPDEIRRLPVGCIRYSDEPSGQITWLDVPANKQNPAYTKPIDPILGVAVSNWEQVRPATPTQVDPKSGGKVDYLFDNDGYYLSKHYLTRTLIPLLCRVAGVPETDSYGSITPNRARHTIAYQLANGREPMPLLELQTWLGHRSPDSTLHYTTRTHLELSQALEQYTARNTRLATVLVDRDAVASGATLRGEPWKYYDLGHGYCTHDFFETCPHRIACARCTSYVTKASSRPQLQEASRNLLRMREAIPLTDEMVTAIDAGLDALTKLLDHLVDTPSSSGETPRELGTVDRRELNWIALTDIPVR